MHNEWLGRLLGCAMLAAAPLMVPTLSDAQAPHAGSAHAIAILG
jgi:hypothetical protein